MDTMTTIQNLLQCNGSAQPVMVALTENERRLIAAAPELLWFCQQVFNGLDTNMIRIDTPADETLANVLARGRRAVAKATGNE